jgi:putative selenium metabolism hydrolase
VSQAIREGGAELRERVTDFCRDLVRIPSYSGEEREAAECAEDELSRLGLDSVEIDRAGNVVGILRANAPDRLEGAVLLNAHLDVVAVDEQADWPHPPFEGVIENGRLFGRGATDTKSSVAAQVQAAGLLARLQYDGVIHRRRDLVVAAVVQEEVGGLGTACLLEDRGSDYKAAVIGEPSHGALAHGHRGRVGMLVRFHGRAAHASRPDWGLNPHASLARFVESLASVEKETDAQLGSSSVSPTQVQSRPDSPNVIPSVVELVLDWRNVPAEEPETILARVADLAEAAAEDGIRTEVLTQTVTQTSWTGAEHRYDGVSRPFGTDPQGELFRSARLALEEGLARAVPAISWDFASDGGLLQAAGVPCLGYGPGDMEVMHAVQESCSLDLLTEAVSAYALLTMALDA